MFLIIIALLLRQVLHSFLGLNSGSKLEDSRTFNLQGIIQNFQNSLSYVIWYGISQVCKEYESLLCYFQVLTSQSVELLIVLFKLKVQGNT